MQAIVPLMRLKAALAHQHPRTRIRVNAQPLNRLPIRCHVRFSGQHSAHAQRSQVVAQRPLVHAQRIVVVARPVAEDRTSRIETHPGRAAQRRGHIGARVIHPLLRQPINVGCLQSGVPAARQVVVAQLVTHDKKDIPFQGASCSQMDS